MSMKKTVTSAVILAPPQHTWGPIQRIRSQYDKAYERWMPHINLLYPFLPHDHLEVAAAVLTNALSSVQPFRVSFKDFGSFDHSGSSHTIWLSPNQSPGGSIEDVQRKIQGAFPMCDDLSSRASGFVPHLTVGQCKGEAATQQLIASFASGWQPIEFTVTELYVIARTEDKPFAIVHTVPLGKTVEIPKQLQPVVPAAQLYYEYTSDGTPSEPLPLEIGPDGFAYAASFARSDESRVAVHLRLKPPPLLETGTSPQTTTKQFFVVLDVSGSMAGAPLNEAKQSIIALVNALREQNARDITLITFNNACSVIPIGESTSVINAISAGGGTSFLDCFKTMSKCMEQAYTRNNNIAIILLTDGQDTSDNQPGKPLLSAALASMKTLLEQRYSSSEMHTLGFGRDHDARLLLELTKGASSPGTFQYIKAPSEIDEAIQSILGLVSGSSAPSVSIRDATGQLHRVLMQREPTENENDLVYEGTAFVPHVSGSPLTLELQIMHSTGTKSGDHHVTPLSVRPVERAPGSLREEIELRVGCLQSRIADLGARVIKPGVPREELNECNREMGDIVLQVDGLESIVFKSKSRVDRKTLMPVLQEVREYIGTFHTALAGAMTNTLTNEKIANLTSLAYKEVTKKGLQKRLAQRAGANVELFDKLEGLVQKAVASINFKELEKKPLPDIYNGIGACALSCMTWDEALRDGDCMCISLDVARSEAAIADPSQVVIRSINQTFVTSESFLDSVQFSLSRDMAAHGGFGRDVSGNIVVGTARESITGVLPLYICEEHWAVARHRIKPLMGWMTTLDIMGYAGSQLRTIPFLVMAKAAFDLTSEFKHNIFEMVKRTCVQIYKEASGPHFEVQDRMSTQVKDIFERYVSDPSVRTVDRVPSNHAFLTQVMCAVEMGDITLSLHDAGDMWNQFWSAICEEEMRRLTPYKYKQLDEGGKNHLFSRMLLPDMARYVDPHVAAYEAEETKKANASAQPGGDALAIYGEVFMKQLRIVDQGMADRLASEAASRIAPAGGSGQAGNDKDDPHVQVIIAEPTEYKGDVTPEAWEAMQTVINDFEGVLIRNVHPLLAFRALLSKDNTKVGHAGDVPYAQIGADTKEKIASLVMQCIMHYRNADRRDAIASGKYLSPFVQDAAKQLLQRTYVDLITRERQARTNAIDDRLRQQRSSEVINKFCSANDAIVAAGMMMDMVKFQGHRDYHSLICALKRKDCAIPIEKLTMLLRGEYLGVRIFLDVFDGQPEDTFVTWHPSRKNLFPIWMCHRALLTKQEWLDLVQHMDDIRALLEKYYARY